MEIGFVKSIDLLNETCRTDDLLDFSVSTSDFQQYLSRIHKHSLVGLVGDFGSGKSTMLYQLEKENSKQWIVFDAWSFPDRKDLWEGFVLDFARKFGKEKEVKKKIDGKQISSNIFSGIDIGTDILSGVSDKISQFFGKEIPDLNFLDKARGFFGSSSARRVFEFKEILKTLILVATSDLFIVLEDIDRSGGEGAVFLEALKQFIEDDLREFNEYKITFIVPMGTKNYDGDCADSYRKSLDYTYRFKPKINFEKFIDAIFIENLFVENPDHWREQLNQLFQYFVRKKTVRDLKKILREANHVFLSKKDIDNFNPDPRMVIMMELFYENGNHIVHLSRERDVRTIPSLSNQENIYSFFCLSICDNIDVSSLQRNGNRSLPEIVFQQDHNMAIPKHWQSFFNEEKHYRLQVSDLYLREDDRV